jgi:hypothetical protein
VFKAQYRPPRGSGVSDAAVPRITPRRLGVIGLIKTAGRLAPRKVSCTILLMIRTRMALSSSNGCVALVIFFWVKAQASRAKGLSLCQIQKMLGKQ